MLVPSSTVTGRSVVSRSVKHGIPSADPPAIARIPELLRTPREPREPREIPLWDGAAGPRAAEVLRRELG